MTLSTSIWEGYTEGKKRTASELGISLATLYRRMGQLGITARKHAR